MDDNQTWSRKFLSDTFKRAILLHKYNLNLENGSNDFYEFQYAGGFGVIKSI